MAEILLLRHGETEWSATGRHTGRTDIPLTEFGQRQARALAPLTAARLGGITPRLVATSPLARARQTAALAGWRDAQVEPDLAEWDYGGYDGLTTPQISESLGRPWSLWTDGVVPGATPGETIEQVAARASAVLARARSTVGAGVGVVLVAHGHLLRVLAACWLGLAPAAGALFALQAGSLSALGFEHDRPVLNCWNLRPVVPV